MSWILEPGRQHPLLAWSANCHLHSSWQWVIHFQHTLFPLQGRWQIPSLCGSMSISFCISRMPDQNSSPEVCKSPSRGRTWHWLWSFNDRTAQGSHCLGGTPAFFMVVSSFLSFVEKILCHIQKFLVFPNESHYDLMCLQLLYILFYQNKFEPSADVVEVLLR